MILLKPVFIIAIVAIAMIGGMVPSVFAEIQYDEQQHFRIDLPNNWISMDNAPSYSGFITSESTKSIFPIIISYGIDDNLTGGIGSISWEFDSVCDPMFTGTVWKSVNGIPVGANRPNLYEYNLKCIDESITELEEWDKDDVHFKKKIEYPTWNKKYEQKVNESKESTIHITSGIEFWNIAYGYNLKILNKIPDLDNQLTAIIDSFEPVTCNERESTEIILTGERNPILKNKYQYNVVVNYPTELGTTYVVLGQNSHTYNIENYANVDNADNGYLRGSTNGDSVNFEITYRNVSYNEGESYIKITNGCHQEIFPIKIWENEPIIKDTLVETDVTQEKIAQLEAEQQESKIDQLEAEQQESKIDQLEAEQQESKIDQLEAEQNGGGCLIATATYGSELAPQVQQLRELRDNQLLNTESGTAFMGTFNDIYYSFSPIIADYERENPYFKEAVKLAITPMISTLSLMENAESESEVLSIGISVIALNLGMYLGVPAVVIVGIRKIK
jgi:hypothetical protein